MFIELKQSAHQRNLPSLDSLTAYGLRQKLRALHKAELELGEEVRDGMLHGHIVMNISAMRKWWAFQEQIHRYEIALFVPVEKVSDDGFCMYDGSSYTYADYVSG